MLQLGYCFTFVRLPPADLLNRLGARDRMTLHGVLAMNGPALDAWNDYGGQALLVGVTDVGDWTFMAELNGFVGVSVSMMAPVVTDSTSVSHYEGAHGVYQFLWMEDSITCLQFEPLFAFDRRGSRADDASVLHEMAAAGFDLLDSPDRNFHNCRAAAFALGERLTGVPITPALLDDSTLECGLVTMRMP